MLFLVYRRFRRFALFCVCLLFFAMYFCFCLHVDLFCWILCRIVFSRCLEICKTLRDFCYFLRLRAMCLQQIASEPLLAHVCASKVSQALRNSLSEVLSGGGCRGLQGRFLAMREASHSLRGAGAAGRCAAGGVQAHPCAAWWPSCVWL